MPTQSKKPSNKRPPSNRDRGRKTRSVATQPRPWGMIAAFVVVALLAAGIIGFGAWSSIDASKPLGERKADQITGLLNVRKSDPGSLKSDHKPGRLEYKQDPPVGGAHSATWQNCGGDVYTEPIAKENAVHSLEHGAVWITYRKGLDADHVQRLADKVKNKDYLLLSPVEGLKDAVSLQAWGFQLAVPAVSDSRIDTFINNFRQKAAAEPSAPCSNGTTETGPEPKTQAAGGADPDGGNHPPQEQQ